MWRQWVKKQSFPHQPAFYVSCHWKASLTFRMGHPISNSLIQRSISGVSRGYSFSRFQVQSSWKPKLVIISCFLQQCVSYIKQEEFVQRGPLVRSLVCLTLLGTLISLRVKTQHVSPSFPANCADIFLSSPWSFNSSSKPICCFLRTRLTISVPSAWNFVLLLHTLKTLEISHMRHQNVLI